MKKNDTRFIVVTGLVAAIYVVITVAFAFMSYEAIQFRISEVMVFLAFIDPLYIPGLVIGCFIANLVGPLGIIDALVGGFATFFAVFMISKCRKWIGANKKGLFVASLFPMLSSAIIALQMYIIGQGSFWYWTIMIGFGELVVVTFVGFPLFNYIMSKPEWIRILTINQNKKR